MLIFNVIYNVIDLDELSADHQLPAVSSTIETDHKADGKPGHNSASLTVTNSYTH